MRVMRFEMACSAAGMDLWRMVMWPIFLPGLGSLPYMWTAAFSVAIASFKMRWCESAFVPPSMLSMIAAGMIMGISSGIGHPSIESRWALYCDIVGQASMV